MSAAEPAAAASRDRVDLIDEHDARRILLRILEKITDTGGSHADKHFHKIRPGDAEERNSRLPGDRFCQQGLSCSRRSLKKHALRDPRAYLDIFLRRLKEIDDLLELFFLLLQPCHIGEGDLDLILIRQPRAALSEVHRLCIRSAVLAVHKKENEEHPGQCDEHRDQDGREHGFSRDIRHPIVYIILVKKFLHFPDVRDIDPPRSIVILQRDRHSSGRDSAVLIDIHIGHISIFHFRFECAVAHLLLMHLELVCHPEYDHHDHDKAQYRRTADASVFLVVIQSCKTPSYSTPSTTPIYGRFLYFWA